MDRTPLEVADLIRAAGPDFIERSHRWLTSRHRKVLTAIERCRTSALGGHVDECSRCGHRAISYNSCRNRHCPKCQGNARERWLADRQQELLPTRSAHVVFTLPHLLAPLALPQLSHFAGSAAAKAFRISGGYPKVFTTGEGAAAYFDAIWEALIRGGGWEGSVIRIWFSMASTSGSAWVCRYITSQLPSTIEIQTSTIWIVANFSNTAAGVNPGACIIRRFFKVTCRL